MNLTLEQWAIVLTAIAAWVGLELSLYNLWQGRPSRRVEVALLSPYFAEVKFINERGRDVVLEEVGVEYAEGGRIVLSPAGGIPLPTEVWPGHSFRYPFPLEQLRIVIQEGKSFPVRVYCRDATGHYYKTPLNQEIRSALRIPPEGSNPGVGGGIEASAGPPKGSIPDL